jgi:LysM domain
MASDSTKKIAKKAARKKYSASASGKARHVKRDDSPNKIAKRHRVKDSWQAFWKPNKKTIKRPSLIFVDRLSRSNRLGWRGWDPAPQ